MAVTIRGSGQVPTQIVQTVLTGQFTTSNLITAPAQITGLTASITPVNSLNKVLVTVQLSAATSQSVNHGAAILYRGATPIGVGSNGSLTPATVGGIYQADNQSIPTYIFSFLDSPATTSSITYSIYTGTDGSGTIYINRCNATLTGSSAGSPISSITLQEIAYA
jgi:hypothetical protein